MSEIRCEVCKTRKAAFAFEQNAASAHNRTFVCLDCAREMEKLEFGSNPPLGSEICHLLVGEIISARGIDVRAACLGCGTTLAEVVSGGYLGCPMCFSRFSEEIEQIALRHHGAVAHRGKTPRGFRSSDG